MATQQSELDKLLGDIQGKMGEGVAMRASRVPSFVHVPTGCFLLDYAMAGGYAEGCGHMVYGLESCGKTTLCHIACASLQRKYLEGHVGWVDVEKKFDPQWAEKLGMDLERTVVVKPRTGEHAVDIVEALARTEQIVGIVLDSIPSLNPMKIIEKSAEDPTVAERARLVGLMCSKLQQAWIDEYMRGHRFTFWAINQFREKIGVMFGDNRTLPGGRFQNYMVDTKLELKAKEVTETVDGQERHTRSDYVFKFTKTKGAFSIKTGEFSLAMDTSGATDGSRTGNFLDHKTVATFAKRRRFITGGGSHWKLPGLEADFSNLAQVDEHLRTVPESDTRLRRLLVMAQRMDSQLPAIPRDQYLFGMVSRVERAALFEIMRGAGYEIA